MFFVRLVIVWVDVLLLLFLIFFWRVVIDVWICFIFGEFDVLNMFFFEVMLVIVDS